uniref:lysozyme n=1 Tax=Trichogramma kaykai TaxID=54128 RepID=A0ABD2XAW9_9HYME
MTSKVSIIGLGLVCCCWLSVLFSAVSAASDQKEDKDSPKLDVICLGCICEAASGCNQTLGCVGDVCGPFHITQIYWTDSGKPTLDSDKPDATDEEGLQRRRRDRLRGLRAHPLSRRLRLLGGGQARQELRQSFQLLPEGIPSCLIYKPYNVVNKKKTT